MKRMPFKMLPHRTAQSRYFWREIHGGKVMDSSKVRKSLRSGRAHFIWMQYVLIPLACGVTDSVEIRESRGGRGYGPWHTITYTPDEAYARLMEFSGLQRASMKRLVESHRRKRGMPMPLDS
jgi:hypothetical protein